ncbi:MAG: hypothetical protein IIB17_04600 [Chloroflexi bacterium]|nr:hypothetical protein [Chloroflexota bacterium]
MELDRLKLTVSKVKSAPNHKEGFYSFNTWVQDIYNLCEKTKRLISSSCSLYSLGKRKDKYRKEVEKNVQTNAGKMRQALVHGADDPTRGGLGINAKAITNDSLWESFVAVGPNVLQYLPDSTDVLAPDWLRRVESATADINGELSSTLHRLENDIYRARSRIHHQPDA